MIGLCLLGIFNFNSVVYFSLLFYYFLYNLYLICINIPNGLIYLLSCRVERAKNMVDAFVRIKMLFSDPPALGRWGAESLEKDHTHQDRILLFLT